LPTPAVGWGIGAGASGPIGCDLPAKDAIVVPGEFQHARPTDDGLTELLDRHVAARQDLPVEQLRQDWTDAFAALSRAFQFTRRHQKGSLVRAADAPGDAGHSSLEGILGGAVRMSPTP